MKRTHSFPFLLIFSSFVAILSSPARLAAQAAQPSSGASTKQLLSKSFTLDGGKVWTDTGIALEPGQKITVAAKGTLRYSDAKADNGPDGLTRGFKDLIRILPFNDAGRGALIGRVGDADVAQPFLIGAKRDVVTPAGGRLSIGINQTSNDTGDGTYKVQIAIYAPDANSAYVAVRTVTAIPGVDNSLF